MSDKNSSQVVTNGEVYYTLSVNMFMITLCIMYTYVCMYASLVAQMVKNLPEMQEMKVRALGQENPLEKGMATHSSILSGKIP